MPDTMIFMVYSVLHDTSMNMQPMSANFTDRYCLMIVLVLMHKAVVATIMYTLLVLACSFLPTFSYYLTKRGAFHCSLNVFSYLLTVWFSSCRSSGTDGIQDVRGGVLLHGDSTLSQLCFFVLKFFIRLLSYVI